MKYALGLVALVAALGFAGATFSGGPGETFTIKGYTKAWFYMNGSDNPEDENPDHAFRGYNWTTLMGRLNGTTYAYLGLNYKTWNSSTPLNVCDAYISMDVIPELNVTAGQFKMPLGWAYNCSGGNLYFLDRPFLTTTDEFDAYAGRDVGVNLHGQFDWVGLDLGVFNGTGIYSDAENYVNKQIVANLTLDPVEWLTVAGGVGMIGESENLPDVPEEWSATGINAYALADYPLSGSSDLIFEGEFWQMGYMGPEVDGMENNAAVAFYTTLGVNFTLQDALIHSVLPAVRYESYSPEEQIVAGAERAEDNQTLIDFCLNVFINPYNTIQIGGRNVSYEADVDGYTDMYLGWRLNY